MSTYVIDYNEENGDIVDRDYFDSAYCMICALAREGVENTTDYHAGTLPHPEGGSVSFGGAPCAASEVDYEVRCAWCSALMHEASDG
jgi:hypothetical protein